MPFMIPQYVRGCYTVETSHGSECLPADLFRNRGARLAPAIVAPYVNGTPTEPAQFHPRGVIARLSAPGYMDCTDWSGPYRTINEAKEAIEQMFDVDPVTGEDLE